jgi:tRNA(fMet)-specific endonuclease VapC
MYLLDTNILSELLKKRPNQKLQKRLADVSPEALVTSGICVMELRYGALRVRDGDVLWARIKEVILAKLRIMGFGFKEAVQAGEILHELHSVGKPIGIEDIMIGSIALSNGLTVVTGNIKHFSRIPGLQVENWLM